MDGMGSDFFVEKGNKKSEVDMISTLPNVGRKKMEKTDLYEVQAGPPTFMFSPDKKIVHHQINPFEGGITRHSKVLKETFLDEGLIYIISKVHWSMFGQQTVIEHVLEHVLKVFCVVCSMHKTIL